MKKNVLWIIALVAVLIIGITAGSFWEKYKQQKPFDSTETVETKPVQEAKPEEPKIIRYKVMLKDLKRFKVKKKSNLAQKEN